ncbi:ribonuclease III [Pelagicoccus sp. SDUM812003]|uniref:ribonuclease III n=1 Tax=Pelagicoccus sp. SDUM812003 TaxID=3041267 RepID=UPI00280E6F05|nr:ribonuclease III [Pelagicoccus sp. SDUM812003]MDQ8205307.1 ribonuclease III [Pelagicoccus sp. SDUM812003]
MVASKLKRFIKSVSKDSDKAKAKRGSKITSLPDKQVKQLESKLGYVFKDKGLLAQSMTHPSFLLNTRDQLKNNQRLEFLGDSVIQLVLTEKLYEKYPRHREGKLTSIRSGYARSEYMAMIARELALGNYLILKPKDRQAGVAENDSALCDAFEALIGAVYLDSDFDTSRKIVLSLYNYLDDAPKPVGGVTNPKGKLQELIQPIHGNNAVRYETTAQSGEAHNREFEVTVYCNDQKLGVGTGRTKKEAAEQAALQGLETFKPETEK